MFLPLQIAQIICLVPKYFMCPIIFFDIEEPVFALECASYTFLFDMNKNGQLEWIEQLN